MDQLSIVAVPAFHPLWLPRSTFQNAQWLKDCDPTLALVVSLSQRIEPWFLNSTQSTSTSPPYMSIPPPLLFAPVDQMLTLRVSRIARHTRGSVPLWA